MTFQDYSVAIGQYSKGDDLGFKTAHFNTPHDLTISSAITNAFNPSYLLYTEQGHYLISECSQQEGSALIFVPTNSEDHQVRLLDGDYPCHLAISPNKELLGVAHYGTGNFEIFALRAHGIIGERIALLANEGSSVHPTRQQAPHGHQLQFIPNSQQFVTVDLGIDTLSFYEYNKTDAVLSQSLVMPLGSGPRHVDFSQDGKFGYVLCELDESLHVIKRSDHGIWQLIYSTSAFPEHISHEAAAAVKLSPNNRFVYLTGRGESIVSWFELSDPAVPAYQGFVSSGGQFPRDLCLSPDGKYLMTANQHSDNLALFTVDEATGAPTLESVSDPITAPVCLVIY